MRISDWSSDVCSSDLVEMLVDRIHGIRHGRVGGRRQHIGEPGHLDDVRRMAATGAFGMEGVDGAVPERRDRILDKAAFIQRVGMDGDLDIMLLGDIQAVVDGGRRSEEHTSELQSLMRSSYAVFCLKKKNISTDRNI